MLTLLAACTAAHHPVEPAPLATDPAAFDARLDEPGPITVETVASADWSVPLSGLLDVRDPAAIAAGKTGGDEPIHVYFHALHHPVFGWLVIDTGVEDALATDRGASAFRGPIGAAAGIDRMVVREPLGRWLDGRPLRGVLLTHLHLDHIAGLADVPRDTPVWTGPGEADARAVMHAATRIVAHRELDGLGPLRELVPAADPSGRFAGLVDVLGDGSLWGIWTPGHTPGSMAFVARTPDGPVLFTGDTSHTRWGWEHDVPPGTFTADPDGNRAALAALRALAAEHPTMRVQPGHQG